jgi:hypothetical protein
MPHEHEHLHRISFGFSPHILEQLDILGGPVGSRNAGGGDSEGLDGHKILVKKANGDTYEATFPFLHPPK